MSRCLNPWWVRLPAFALCGLMVACAAPNIPTPISTPPSDLFQDERFAPSTEPVDPASVFALSNSMQSYLRGTIAREARSDGTRGALLDALYRRGKLRLEYENDHTRTAAEAFDARAGNCLSLVLMTAAFARALDLDVRFNWVMAPVTWTRQDHLLVGSGHVNITLGARRGDVRLGREDAPLTVDFMPQEQLVGMRVRPISEAAVMALYMNNRAVEMLSAGRIDEAYAFAREAVNQDPSEAILYNTLGVIYKFHGDLDAAARAFEAGLARDPGDMRVIANLADVRSRQGSSEVAAALWARLPSSEVPTARALTQPDATLISELPNQEDERARH
jgi:tetratricopeptide (TPR) repeat protein